ncbi:universal stress protein [Streptomyces boluensis]|uniref:Universal stress protein n=1 Tax=Streptomyces boluensis TaxID=1775135 RepID=A0A964ULY3_9ACTN|nr:universal stress protein [Streptomyces boluensis]NBE50926.1 universal stress protein [Streptomyces boluensis]
MTEAGAGRPVLVGLEQAGEPGAVVVRYAAQHAALHGRPLRLLHIERAERGGLPGSAAEARQRTQARVDQAMATVLAPMTELVQAEFPQVQVAAEAVTGHAAETLVERSAEASWLIVGHRGTGGFARLPLGSVSWQAATHAHCPVIVIRPRTGGTQGHRVVVGVDVPDIPQEALDLAYAEAHLRGVGLLIVHGSFHFSQVPTGPGMAVPDFEVLDQSLRKTLEAEIAKRREQYPDLPVGLHLERIRPATALAEASEYAGLLVVGSHARSGLRRLMLGSVSAEALHTAACPVAVVPPSGKKA